MANDAIKITTPALGLNESIACYTYRSSWVWGKATGIYYHTLDTLLYKYKRNIYDLQQKIKEI